MTHPLTDDFCHRIAESWPPDAAEKDNMRSAADWQLEQVIKWLRENLDERYIVDGDVLDLVMDVESVVIDLKQAMRPTTTTTQEDN